MNVAELIEKLQSFDPNTPIGIVYDGAERMGLQAVWLARSGSVLVSGANDVVYEDEDRPQGAPPSDSDPYWDTSKL